MNPESAASKISPERLKKYADFVEVHSDLQPDGTLVYNPEKALVGLLSILTPDPKGIVLAGMEDGVIYSTRAQIYSDIHQYLGNFGIHDSIFPITLDSVWDYIGEKRGMEDGSLVRIGAVARRVINYGDLETFGYMRSEAGRDLGIPLVYQAIEFVNKASENGTAHKFDSMWRILGSINSSTGQRKSWTIYKVIEYLKTNPRVNKLRDIQSELKSSRIHSESSLFYLLKSLLNAGIIGGPPYSANDLSRMFYDMVLVPAREEAFSLSSMHTKLPRTDKITKFLQNYSEERSRVGPQGGEEIRDRILRVLSGNKEVKYTHLAQTLNDGYQRELHWRSFRHHMNNLILEGIIVKTKPGYFKLKVT